VGQGNVCFRSVARHTSTWPWLDKKVHRPRPDGSATEGVVTSSGNEVLAGQGPDTPAEPHYDNVYILDARGWYCRYSHLKFIDPAVRPGVQIKMGQKLGVIGKEGHKLLSRGKILSSSQATYHGLKKPKEAFHDTDLYRLYHKVNDEIESRGGRVLRVQLDYEMKQELYARLARACQDKNRNPETLRKEIAERYHLKVVSGRIPIPDLRIEYVNQKENEIQRRDLELATEHYRPRGLSQKARAGFQIYARHGETDRLRRIRDDQELSAAILGF
jgi:hypothetical protein